MKVIFLFLLCCSFAGTFAQNINEHTIVKDSAGTVYPVSRWRYLIHNGNYKLKPEDEQNPNTAYWLVRLSDEEKEKRLAKLPRPKQSNYFHKGDLLSLGSLTDIEGAVIDLNIKGKITVINFWFINCIPCRKEIPDLNALVEKYGSDSVRFIAIAPDARADLKKFLGSTSFLYNVADSGQDFIRRLRVQSFPTHVILTQKGEVYFHTSGLAANTVYWLEKSIKELLHQSSTSVTAAP